MADPLPSSSGRPPRRPRYRGQHPRRFEEKYKELAPQRFPDEASKVRSRGQTPAGSHVPVMLAEVLEVLRPVPGNAILDCTVGFGGHAAALAERVGPAGRLLALDLDREELAATASRLRAAGVRLDTRCANFAGAARVLAEAGLDGVDVLLADLGPSSMQLDRPERGFSFKQDGPLDMRMDRSRGRTAAEWLRACPEDHLAEVLAEWGEDPDARRIAAAVREACTEGHPPERTAEFRDLILRAKSLDPEARLRRTALDAHPAARAFQAVRMAVNREPGNLQELLRVLPQILRPGGRAAILAFHSGEDRLVKIAFQEGKARGFYGPGDAGPRRPSREEIFSNPRARSAKLRWVVCAGGASAGR